MKQQRGHLRADRFVLLKKAVSILCLRAKSPRRKVGEKNSHLPDVHLASGLLKFSGGILQNDALKWKCA